MNQPKSDITDRADIEKLVNDFYRKVKADPVIGYIFTEVAALDWDHHLPTMYAFWESVLLDAGTYRGNPILKHIELDGKLRLTPEHFDQWKKLFNETVDDAFEGPKADLAKQRAEMMAQLMWYKIGVSREEGFIQ